MTRSQLDGTPVNITRSDRQQVADTTDDLTIVVGLRRSLAMRAAGLLFLLLGLAGLAFAKEVREEFKILPNAPGKVEVALDTPPIAGSTCTFEWDASGATPELWTAAVTGDPAEGDLACFVTRAGGKESYLMFKSFKTTLGTSPVIDAEVRGNDNDALEHAVDGECVKNHHTWSGGGVRSIKLTSMVDI